MTSQLTRDDLNGDNWYDFANCRGIEIDVFYPSQYPDESHYPNYAQAKRICDNCQVRDLCLMSALAEEMDEARVFGMRGGAVPQERARLITLISGRRMSQWKQRTVHTANLEALAIALYAEGDESRRRKWDSIKLSRLKNLGQL